MKNRLIKLLVTLAWILGAFSAVICFSLAAGTKISHFSVSISWMGLSYGRALGKPLMVRLAIWYSSSSLGSIPSSGFQMAQLYSKTPINLAPCLVKYRHEWRPTLPKPYQQYSFLLFFQFLFLTSNFVINTWTMNDFPLRPGSKPSKLM